MKCDFTCCNFEMDKTTGLCTCMHSREIIEDFDKCCLDPELPDEEDDEVDLFSEGFRKGYIQGKKEQIELFNILSDTYINGCLDTLNIFVSTVKPMLHLSNEDEDTLAQAEELFRKQYLANRIDHKCYINK